MSGGGGDEGTNEWGAPTLAGVNAVLKKHLQECALTNQSVATELRGLNVGHQEIKTSIKTFESNAWKALGALMTIILGAAITILFQSLQFRQDVPTRSEVEARTASRYTMADAARDRAAQDEVNQAILKELQAIRRGRR